MRLLRLLTVAGALAPATLLAQLPVSTGISTTGSGNNVRDTRWQIGYALNSSSNPAASPTAPTTFVDAFRIANPPGAWQSPVSFAWVGAEGSSGSVPGGVGDGARRFTYHLRTDFSVASGELLTLRMQCSFDNFWLGLFINGTQFGTNVCGNDNTFRFPTEFTVGPSNFVTGSNRLEFRWQGDGVTDAIAVRVNSAVVTPDPTVVPEPSTYALMATGLAGLAALRRRRAALQG